MDKNMASAGWLAGMSAILLFIGLDFLRQRERQGYEKIFSAGKNPLVVLAEQLGPVIAPWFPIANIEGIEQLITWAGKPYNLNAELFIGLKAVLCGVGFVAGTGLSLAGLPSVFAFFIAAVAYFIPDYYIRQKADERKKGVSSELPLMLDFLVTSLKAGVELVPAMNLIGSQLKGPLGEELRKATREIMTGKPRTRALKDMAQRTGVEELERFIETLTLTEERGNQNIAQSMDDFSAELRRSRLARAEEEARKLPTKIVAPLIVCIFLPMIILIVAPIMSIISKAM